MVVETGRQESDEDTTEVIEQIIEVITETEDKGNLETKSGGDDYENFSEIVVETGGQEYQETSEITDIEYKGSLETDSVHTHQCLASHQKHLIQKSILSSKVFNSVQSHGVL